MWHSGRVTALHAAVPGSVGIYDKEFLPETRRDGGGETQLLFSIPNIARLDPKFLLSAYDVKVYVLLKAIRPLDGDIKPGNPLGVF